MSATDQRSPTKHKLRWYQFSLRTLLLLVTVACICLGFPAKRARDQRRAVQFLRTFDGVQIETLESLMFLNLRFDPSYLAIGETVTVDSLVDPNIGVRSQLIGGGFPSETDFDVNSARFDALESWLVTQRPGLDVSWGYND